MTYGKYILAITMTMLSTASIFAATVFPSEEFILLTVAKNNLTAELKTLPALGGSSQTLRMFKIAIGKNKGDKLKEGDHKTPEGLYFTQTHIDTTQHAYLPIGRYGERAIPLDFPNPFDRYQNKTGYGIWLHGAGDDSRMAEANVTKGCVVFYNADILKLTAWLKPYQGVVAVAREHNEINQQVLLETMHKRFDSWIQSWRSSQINQYIDFYHPEFVHGRRGKSSYKSYKQRVFGQYDKMSIQISNLRVITHPKYAITVFNQEFSGHNHKRRIRFHAAGKKTIYWVSSPSGFQILREDFKTGRTFKPLAFSEQDHRILHTQKKIDKSQPI